MRYSNQLLLLILLESTAVLVSAQTMTDLTRQGKLGSGTALPSHCSTGQLFLKSNSPGASALYTCTALDTWSLFATPVLGGDLSGGPSAATVKAVQGLPVSSSAPNDQDVFRWSAAAGQWQPMAAPNSYVAGEGIAVAGNSLSVEDALVPEYFAGSGPPLLDCMTGRDFYVDSAAGALYFCKAQGQWQQVSLTGHTHTAADITSGTLSIGLMPSSTVFNSQANAYAAGQRQSVSHSTANAGLRLIPAPGDPSSSQDGDVWYNATTGRFRRQQNGIVVDWDMASGNAATATALAATPPQCLAGQYSTGIAVNGAANCNQVAYAQVSGMPAIPAASSATPAMNGAAAAGASSNYARADHVHPIDASRQATIAGAPGAWPSLFAPSAHAGTHQNGGTDEVATATPAANAIPKAGSAGALAAGWIPILNQSTTGTAAGLAAQYVDWNAAGGGTSIANKPTVPAASSATPAMNGIGGAGASSNYARADHVHPADTSRQAAIAGAPGAWPAFAAVATSGSYADLSNKPAIPPAQVYPGAGVASSTGSVWSSSYTVGTGPNNLVQLNGSSQLPGVSAALLTNFPALNQSTTGNAATATALAATPLQCVSGQYSTGVAASGAANCAQVAYGNLTGQAALSQFPAIANNTVLGNTSGGSATPSALSTLPASALPATVVQTNQSNTVTGGTQDLTGAAHTMTIKSGLTAVRPSTCAASTEFYNVTDAPTGGQQVYVCNSAGTGWNLVGDGGSGGSYTMNTAGQGVYDPMAGRVGFPSADQKGVASPDWSNGGWAMYQFTVPFPIRLTKFYSISGASGTSGDVLAVAVFNDNGSGSPGSKITGTDVVKVGNTSVTYQALAWGSQLTLSAGTYWIGYSYSSTTGIWYQTTGAAGTYAATWSGLFNSGKLFKCTNTVTYNGSSTVLPGSCTQAAPAGTSYAPLIGIMQ